MICISIMVFMVLFSGCDVSDTNKITLTVDNASDYLEFNIKAGGADAKYNSYLHSLGYASVFMSGEINGISGYSYDNVVVTIACSYSFEDNAGGRLPGLEWKYHTTLSETVKLNVGGNGKIEKKEDLEVLTNCIEYFKNIECPGYVIQSISGTVSKQ